jgi:hypothetical protein
MLTAVFLYLTYYRASLRVNKARNDSVLAAKAFCSEFNDNVLLTFLINDEKTTSDITTACKQLLNQ